MIRKSEYGYYESNLTGAILGIINLNALYVCLVPLKYDKNSSKLTN